MLIEHVVQTNPLLSQGWTYSTPRSMLSQEIRKIQLAKHSLLEQLAMQTSPEEATKLSEHLQHISQVFTTARSRNLLLSSHKMQLLAMLHGPDN